MSAWLLFVLIGTASGIAAGIFGVGGGLIVVPALIYCAGFTQHMATGTSLAVLLPPIGFAAAFEYYRNGNVNVPAAIIIAITMFLGAWFGARLASHISGPHLRLLFGLFVCCLGIYLVFGAYEHMR
ncbi:sulfite exporter TauE/SafE family protein [Pseudomonas moorei]|jgi:uncharacterized membrane protein YfcA|uniref:Probable membrane transporter protein n=1 Tax=Pseudomonas moorei TaxID=395599 RepID=A0A1H1G1F1_9PSED|nr:sulfite exporter TauE/SafE family protein [Pseudomonas moorei]KAB0503145.1 sulfite exporter TauE/SafE family protein [Pseudomonas moorei]SDR06963.1 hypothetical protein SAMN04490195_3030 [Pseudomonas moorei]